MRHLHLFHTTLAMTLLLGGSSWGQIQSSEWEMVARPGRSFHIPQLKISRAPHIAAEINREIDRRTAGWRCSPDIRAEFANREFDVKLDVKYDRFNIFSIYVHMSYYCGGAYPSYGPDSMNFDLATGGLIQFGDLFDKYTENKARIVSIIFDKQLERSKHYDPAQDDGTCKNSDVFSLSRLVDSRFDFTFSADGLEVQPLWPHVIAACADRVLVPYEVLSQFSAPQGPLSRVLEETSDP